MPIGCDIGTMFLVKGEIDPIDDGVSFELERNVFAEVREGLEDPEEILKNNGYSYAKFGEKIFVVGEDVFKIHEIESLFKKSGAHSYFSEVRRPMQNGLLNTSDDKMSIAIIQEIIKKLVGKPNEDGEVLCFCAPGDPINSKNNVLFHKMMLTNFVKSLGYTPECINEALAIIYSECPTAEDPKEPDGISKFSGLGISAGAGMINVVCAWKQLPLLSFSIENSGDWIDQESARIAGCDVASITKFKEKHLDLANIDQSDIKQLALDVYYTAMIENTMKQFASKFEKLDNKIDTALDIVVAGGTASVPGFIEKFKQVLSTLNLPFKIKEIKLAKNPLYAVCNGCLIKAVSVENKLKNKAPTKGIAPKKMKIKDIQ